MKKYSFVVLTYNSRKTIESCIQSILDAKGEVEKEVIVVDNASTDDTVEFVQKRFGDKITLIVNKQNKGFSGGVNDGFKAATGNYCVLLNPDADVITLDFEKSESHFENEKVAVVAPKIFWPNGKLQPSFGSFPTIWKLFLYFFKFQWFLPGGFLVFENRWNMKLYETPHEIDWASGCFMIIRRDVLKEVDYFDENYFLYVEDVDFCKRVRDEGYTVILDPTIEISHILQASVRQDPIRNFDHQAKGFIYYFKTHHNSDVSWFINFVYSIYKLKTKLKGK